MNRHLLRGTFRGNLLIVGGNEWGDIMHAELVARAGLGRQEQCCTRNVYLAPGVEGFVELQTVHGSADDIAGRGEVNPTATLRAAAAALEEVGCAGAAAAVEHALAEVAGRGLATPDAGGRASTRELVEAVIAGALEAARRDERPLGPEEKPARVGALVVVDAQGDVCGPGGRFAELGLVDAARAEALGERLVRLVAAARAGRVPVVFVRTLDVAALLPAGLAARGRLASARGAEPFGAVPLEGEAVIAKRGHDALHRTELEARLRGLGAARIALAGAFTDLSIDATARTAREAGFEATVVEDATLPLERAQADALGFLRRYYGVDIATTASLEAAWRRERADERTPARGVELAR
jgi:nicotinamidase-related amidase